MKNRPSLPLDERVQRYVIDPKDKKMGKALLLEAITDNAFPLVKTLLDHGVESNANALKLAKKTKASQQIIAILDDRVDFSWLPQEKSENDAKNENDTDFDSLVVPENQSVESIENDFYLDEVCRILVKIGNDYQKECRKHNRPLEPLFISLQQQLLETEGGSVQQLRAFKKRFDEIMANENNKSQIETHTEKSWKRYLRNTASVLLVLPAVFQSAQSYYQYRTLHSLQFWKPRSEKLVKTIEKELNKLEEKEGALQKKK